MSEFDGAAGFHDLEHGDQALLLRAFAEEVLDEFLLLGPALEGLIGNAGLGDLSLRVIDESLRLLLDERQEIHAAHFETTIDPDR